MHGDYSLQYCILYLKVAKKADLQNFHHINKKLTMCGKKKRICCSAGDLGPISGLGRSPGEGKKLPTAVFGPGEFYGQRSLAGCSPWGCKESNMASDFHFHFLWLPRIRIFQS